MIKYTLRPVLLGQLQPVLDGQPPVAMPAGSRPRRSGATPARRQERVRQASGPDRRTGPQVSAVSGSSHFPHHGFQADGPVHLFGRDLRGWLNQPPPTGRRVADHVHLPLPLWVVATRQGGTFLGAHPRPRLSTAAPRPFPLHNKGNGARLRTVPEGTCRRAMVDMCPAANANGSPLPGAVLLDPPVLVLDDSTSSVDANTEELIRQALVSPPEAATPSRR